MKYVLNDCVSLQEYKSEKWNVMWYKNGQNIGIKRKWGTKAQVITFGGKRCGLSEEIQRSFADEALRKLDAGVPEKDVKDWADEAVSV